MYSDRKPRFIRGFCIEGIGRGMAVTIIPYKGFELRAAAFEVETLGAYISSLLIVRLMTLNGNSKLFEPPCSSASGFFDTEQEAIAAAVSFGEKIVDGQAGELTVADL